MFIIFSFIISLIFGFWAFQLAKKQQRNPWFWFSLGVLLGIFGILLLFIVEEIAWRKSSKIVEKTFALSSEENLFFENQENSQKFWYFINEEEQSEGAMSFQKFRELYEDKKIHSLTYVWNASLPTWQRLKDLMQKSTS